MRASFLALFFLLLALPVSAQVGDLAVESLPPAQQSAARALWNELRCVVCQGQSVAESRAPLAADMREFVVEQLREGRTPQEVRGTLVARYGTRILLQPPVESRTWGLWLAPFVFLALGIWLIFRPRTRHA